MIVFGKTKYIRREGSPGNYKYFYKEPIGRKKKASTDSPAFRNWFKSSKVVDKSGKPLVIYHGSPKPGFSTFEGGSEYQRVKGIYFTASAKVASKYTKVSGEHRGAVYPVYLSLQNPADRSVLLEIGYGPSGAEMREELIKRGYDGVMDDLMDEIVAFYPEQIKSVFNRGSWNPKESQIMKTLLLGKGRKALPVGTIREYGGKKFKRMATGWQYVGRSGKTIGEKKEAVGKKKKAPEKKKAEPYSYKGTYYFNESIDAERWAKENNWPTDRIILYGRGYAIQAGASGNYAGPGEKPKKWEGTEKQKARISVRGSTYHDKKGWTISGKDKIGRKVSIFTPERDKADRIAKVYRETGEGGDPVSAILMEGAPKKPDAVKGTKKHSEVEEFEKLAAKNPEKIDKLITRARGALASIALGRDFGESMEDFISRNPSAKRRTEAYEQSIEILEGKKKSTKALKEPGVKLYKMQVVNPSEFLEESLPEKRQLMLRKGCGTKTAGTKAPAKEGAGKDEAAWDRAKAEAKKGYPEMSEDDDKYWRIVQAIYKNMK